MKRKTQQTDWLKRIYLTLLMVIFGGIILHAPLSVGLGTLFPYYDLLIKSWKEILMGVAVIFSLILLARSHAWRLLKEPVILFIFAFCLLHLLILPFTFQGTKATLAGILIDLRYVLYFVLVYVAIRLYPEQRKFFLWIGIAGALLVTVFATLQVTVLPKNILSYMGYNNSTITPYLTVDKNAHFIRVNSTLRGPNPLGAYAGAVIALLVAYLVRKRLPKSNRLQSILGILAACSVVAVWVSYSRSAVAGALIGAGVVLVVVYGTKVSKKVWLSIAALVVVLAIGIFTFRNNSFISNVVFHQNLHGGSKVDSNQGHVSSVETALHSDTTHLFGAGVGSTGSASLYGSHPLIIENQYLFAAHEAGWLALIVFVVLYVVLLRGLWKRRADWLALGMFASGIGLGVIGLLLPVWADDTVSIVWWGMAAVALARPVVSLTPKDETKSVKRRSETKTKETQKVRSTKKVSRG